LIYNNCTLSVPSADTRINKEAHRNHRIHRDLNNQLWFIQVNTNLCMCIQSPEMASIIILLYYTAAVQPRMTPLNQRRLSKHVSRHA